MFLKVSSALLVFIIGATGVVVGIDLIQVEEKVQGWFVIVSCALLAAAALTLLIYHIKNRKNPENRKTLVLIESPFAGKTPEETERNIAYARACMHDSLTRYGEAPYASHLLYTQPGVLKDGDPEERKLGIESGLAFGRVVDKSAVYIDFSVTTGMKQGIERANKEGRTVEYRALPKDVLLELLQKFDQRPKKEIRKVK